MDNKNALDELRKKYETVKQKNESKGTFNDDLFVKVEKAGEEGAVNVRLLPGVANPQEFYVQTQNHKIGENTYACGRLEGDDCPICQLYFDIWKDINKAGKDSEAGKKAQAWMKEKKGFRPNNLYYMNVLDRRDGKVRVLCQFSDTFEKIMAGFFDADYGNGEIPVYDPEKGWDFKLVMTKNAGGYTSFVNSTYRPKQSKLDNHETVWAQRHDLNKFKKEVNYEELRAISDLRLNEYRHFCLGIGSAPSTPATQPTTAASSDGVGGEDKDFQASLEA